MKMLPLALYATMVTGFKLAPHQVYLCNRIERFIDKYYDKPTGKEIKVMVINLPAGFSKSLILSTVLPSWLAGHYPNTQIGIISAKQELVTNFETVVKSFFESPIYNGIFTHPDNGIDRSRGWRKGALYLKGLPDSEASPTISAASLSGNILGKRFRVGIVDDGNSPLVSQSVREFEFSKFTSELWSRIIPAGLLFVVHQRLDEHDFTAKLKEQDIITEHVIIPALVNGKSTWEDRYSTEYFEQLRKVHPERFEVWYQQRIPDGYGTVKAVYNLSNFQTYDTSTYRPKYGKVRFWDTALKEHGDGTAFVDVTWDGVGIYLSNPTTVNIDSNKLIEYAQQVQVSHPVNWNIVEDKGSGTTLIQQMRALGIKVHPYTPIGSKVERSVVASMYINSGKAHFDQASCMDNAEFKKQMSKFPNTAIHDEFPDVVSMACETAIKKPILLAIR